MSAAVPRLPPAHPDQVTSNRRVAETVNNILGFKHDDSRIQTAAEVAAGVTPVNYAYYPGHVWRLGADPTGAADSATAISNTIKTNGFAYIPAGTYKIGSQITITAANVRIYGDGRGSILQSTSASFNLFEVRANDVRIDDLALLGSASDETTTQFGIFTASAFAPLRLKVFNCYFGGASNSARLNDGIKFDDNCSYGEVAWCTIDNMQGSLASGKGYGVLVGNLIAAKIHHNRIFGAAPTTRGRHAVYLSAGASYCEVTDNYSVGMNLEHFPMNALAAQSPCSYNIIARNICVQGSQQDASTGQISIWGGGIGNQIIDNLCISSGQKGIVVNQDNVDGAATCADNVVKGNWVYGAGTTGISIEGSVRTQFHGNRVWNSSQNAAGVSANINLRLGEENISGVVDCSISGNYVSGPQSRCALRIDPSTPVPTGTYIGPNDFRTGASDIMELNGVAVAGVRQWTGQVATKVSLTYSASISIDASQGNVFEIAATNTTAFTINAPSNPIDGQVITLIIANDSGGAMGAITWAGAFHMSSWTNPANGNYRSVAFVNDGGSGGNWKQISATGVDIPN